MNLSAVAVLPADDTLLTGPLETAGDVHFTLCNPPFFDSEDPTEGEQARARRPPPPGAPSGLREEVSCPGGERAFVGRMIAESVTLRDRCRYGPDWGRQLRTGSGYTESAAVSVHAIFFLHCRAFPAFVLNSKR